MIDLPPPPRRPLARFIDALGLRFAARAFREFLHELLLYLRHLGGKLRARRYRGQTGLKLHLASGLIVKPGWINIDQSRSSDLALDLRKPLPFDTASCAITHSEHFLEHLDYPFETMHFLRECWRVTEPGGRLSVGVPDAGEVMMRYAQYQQAPPGEFERQPWHPPWVETWAGRVNFCFRNNFRYDRPNHRYAFDIETLTLALQRAGFEDVKRREFDPATDAEARRDTTMYVAARKPG